MKCIQVLPILKHTFSEELTYWTTHSFEVGDLIQVELNHRQIYAVVSSIVPLSEAKEFIKSRDFNIKKIHTYSKIDFFSNAYILAVLQTSTYYVRSFGEVLSEYIPKKTLEQISQLEVRSLPEKKDKSTTETSLSPVYIQKSFAEQIDHITTCQKKYSRICIIAPTDAYKKHITQHLQDTEHTLVITPIDMYMLDEKDIDVCILTYAGSEYYRHARKGFDTRYMIRTYCNLRNLQLVEMDSVLPVYAHVEIKTVQTATPKTKPEVHIVDQTISKTAKVTRGTKGISKPEDDVDVRNFMEADIDIVTHKKLKLISPELYALIIYAQKQKEDVFIYTTRKGLSSSVVCSDCGHVLTCDICKKPYRLEIHEGITSYTCPENHPSISIDSVCSVCGSIHMQGLGAGTDALVAELTDTISMPILTIDSTTATQAGVRNIFKKRSEKNHIPTLYIGTELAIHQSLAEKFAYSAIASLETLLSLPSPIAELEAARTIEHMREKTTDTLVIQTRTPEHIVWACLKEKTWNDLTSKVQKDTQELSLPPYTTHIQCYISTSYKKAHEDMKTIQDYIQSHANIKAIHVQDTMRHVLHIFIPENTHNNTRKGLYKYLKSLPSYVRIEVDSPTLM